MSPFKAFRRFFEGTGVSVGTQLLFNQSSPSLAFIWQFQARDLENGPLVTLAHDSDRISSPDVFNIKLDPHPAADTPLCVESQS